MTPPRPWQLSYSHPSISRMIRKQRLTSSIFGSCTLTINQTTLQQTSKTVSMHQRILPESSQEAEICTTRWIRTTSQYGVPFSPTSGRPRCQYAEGRVELTLCGSLCTKGAGPCPKERKLCRVWFDGERQGPMRLSCEHKVPAHDGKVADQVAT